MELKQCEFCATVNKSIIYTMKKYFRFLFFAFISLIIITIVLDLLYTSVYKYSNSNRSVLKIALDLKDKDIDYVLLGSSRVIHYLDEKQLNEKYHLNGMNLALSAARTNEMLLLTEALMRNNNKIKTLFIQLDGNWNDLAPNALASNVIMPFIREDFIAENYRQYSTTSKYYYIPFYRYVKYEPLIGFRNIVQNFIKKKSLSEVGFVPLRVGVFRGAPSYEYTLCDEMNANVERIIAICKQNNINPVFFTSPIYNLNANNEMFDKYLSDYTDFSAIFSDSTLFQDELHLNRNGALLFTEIFGKHYFE